MGRSWQPKWTAFESLVTRWIVGCTLIWCPCIGATEFAKAARPPKTAPMAIAARPTVAPPIFKARDIFWVKCTYTLPRVDPRHCAWFPRSATTCVRVLVFSVRHRGSGARYLGAVHRLAWFRTLQRVARSPYLHGHEHTRLEEQLLCSCSARWRLLPLRTPHPLSPRSP